MGKRSKVEALLQEARSTRQYVRVHRRIPGCEDIDGYVVDIGDKWALISRLDGMVVLDGFVAVRLSDITGVVARTAQHAFTRRALEIRGVWPPDRTVPALDLDSRVGVLSTAGATYPLINVHIEKVDPDVCFIGAFEGIRDSSLLLESITPGAEWEDELTVLKLSDITRVDIGGRYESALRLVAGARPDPRPPE